MKKIQKILIALLAMLLCVATLASCGTAGGNKLFGAFESGDGTQGSGDVQKPSTEAFDKLQIVKYSGGRLSSDYRIVISNTYSTDYDKKMATDLQAAIKNITGVTIPVIDQFEDVDDPSTLRRDTEIVIGDKTNRFEEFVIPDEIEPGQVGYGIYTVDQRLVIYAGSSVGMYFALCDFIKEQFGQDIDALEKGIDDLQKLNGSAAAIVLSKDYRKSKPLDSAHLPYVNVALDKYKIMYDGQSYMLKRMAFAVRQSIIEATGVKTTVTAGNIENASGAVIRLQLLDKEELDGEENEWIEPGKWNFEYKDRGFTIQASSYYGFLDATTYFKTALNSKGFYDFGKDDQVVTASGDYLDNVTGIYEATKYAYAEKNNDDIRVMFLNVLFNDTAKDNSGTKTYNVPTAERNQIQQIMIGEYMPDVLGCQEFNNTKRGVDKKVAETLAGNGGLAGLLADIGYAEVVDPRVANARKELEYENGVLKNPQDIILSAEEAKAVRSDGLPQGGYGTGGAFEVNYNGVQYTYYNNTPIFYNTATTKMIAGDYYWYRYQWDKRVGVEHQNGPSDCGSKAMTWGVFESIATGQQYIVVSTHMCTRSDYIRGFQGREVVEQINKLVEMYDCPVFFGGDMNGTRIASNYQYFVSEKGGLINLQDTLVEKGVDEEGNPIYGNLASEFTSKLSSHHGYPNLDEDIRLMTPGENGANKVTYVSEDLTKGGSIDHIFVKNLNEDTKIRIYGIVVDDCSLSSSDHLPIFVDFTMEGEDNSNAEWGPTVVG